MIFPAPHARETISSFGYRIARLCGLASLPELTHMLDIDLQALLRGDAASIGQFARHARCDPDRLSRAALDARNTRHLRIDVMGSNLVAASPYVLRVCPCCLQGLQAKDSRQNCLGRTDRLVDANSLFAEHGLRLIALRPPKARRVQHDLSALVDRLNGRAGERWIDTIQLDVAIKTAKILWLRAQRGPGG